MKTNKVSDVIKAILSEQKNTARHIEHLDSAEKQRALIGVLSTAIPAGYNPLVMETIELLGFRNEEVLIFATAAIGGGRPQLVPEIVRKFCDDTAIAKYELGRCITALLNQAKYAETTWHLVKAVECVKLLQEKIEVVDNFMLWTEATVCAVCILHTCTVVKDQSYSNSVKEELRKMVPDDNTWKLLQENMYRFSDRK